MGTRSPVRSIAAGARGYVGVRRQSRKDGATGIDEMTAASYARDLQANLQLLLDRAKSGRYRAPPVRRVYIPRVGGKRRPIGIPTFEDKILQRAVAMVLEPLYEQDFKDCSYGFRPRRSAHQALEAFWRQCHDRWAGWVLEVDIQGFFDTLGHAHLREFLARRVRDGVLKRLIGKWLKFWEAAKRTWRKWLGHRSQKAYFD